MTRKIRLDMETLRVASFDTGAADGERDGTVHGHQNTRRPTCAQTCFSCDVGCTNTQPIVSCFDPCG